MNNELDALLPNEDDDTGVAELDSQQLRNALAAIAQEVLKFHGCETSKSNFNDDPECDESNDDGDKELEVCKTKLKSKRKAIRNLREHLKTACMIAKTALTAKETDMVTYNNSLTTARNECDCLMKQNAAFSEEVQRLSTENQILADKLQNMRSFIEIGYLELQKMRNEDPGDLPALMQLKKIMVCCGQYYADFCNERERSLQLEQKNRYLNNKVNILESSLDAVTDEMNKSKCQKFFKKGSNECRKVQAVGYVCSEYRIGQSNKFARTSDTTSAVNKSEPVRKPDGGKQTALPSSKQNSLDLSGHLALVNNLLVDQDSMLKELKKLSNDLVTLTI